MDFPTRIKQLRTRGKLTQEQLGKKINVSKVSVSGYESGNRTPDMETLQKIADFFKVSIDYLLGRTNDPAPPVDGDEPPLTPEEEKEWAVIQKELSQDDALFFHQFLKAPNKKKRQLIKYWEHILMDDDED